MDKKIKIAKQIQKKNSPLKRLPLIEEETDPAPDPTGPRSPSNGLEGPYVIEKVRSIPPVKRPT